MIRIIKEKSGKCIQNVFLETPFLKGFGSNTEEMWVVSFHPARSFSRSLGLSLMISSQLLAQCSSDDTPCDGDKPSFRECCCSSMAPTARASQAVDVNSGWLGVQVVKNLPTMQETQVPSLDQEDILEKGMATCSSVLAWEMLWTEEPGGL